MEGRGRGGGGEEIERETIRGSMREGRREIYTAVG